MTKIISIDPGYERLGIAVFEDGKLLFSECFKTSAALEFSKRILLIGIHLQEIIDQHKPTVFTIENLFLNTNHKTVMKVSEVRGVLIYVAEINKLKIHEFTPLQIKAAITGSGRSDKLAVEKMIKILLPDIAKMERRVDDEYDAIACGLAYFALKKTLC